MNQIYGFRSKSIYRMSSKSGFIALHYVFITLKKSYTIRPVRTAIGHL